MVTCGCQRVYVDLAAPQVFGTVGALFGCADLSTFACEWQCCTLGRVRFEILHRREPSTVADRLGAAEGETGAKMPTALGQLYRYAGTWPMTCGQRG